MLTVSPEAFGVDKRSRSKTRNRGRYFVFEFFLILFWFIGQERDVSESGRSNRVSEPVIGYVETKPIVVSGERGYPVHISRYLFH